jgi:hypothetical protein
MNIEAPRKVNQREAALLADIRAHHVVRRLGTVERYDWNENTGRDVTKPLLPFQRHNWVTLMDRKYGLPPLWRLTKAGYEVLDAALARVER